MDRISSNLQLKQIQSKLENLLFIVQQDSEGNVIFNKTLDDLIGEVFKLRTDKSINESQLFKQGNKLIEQAQKAEDDYQLYSKNRAEYFKRTNKKENRGGSRKGAGRKGIGTKKPVSITLSDDDWFMIDNLIKDGKFKNYPEFFREIVKAYRRNHE